MTQFAHTLHTQPAVRRERNLTSENNELTNKQTDRQTNKQKDGETEEERERGRQRDRETEGQGLRKKDNGLKFGQLDKRDKQIHRQLHRQADRKLRQTNKQINTFSIWS